jgi:hypothetical protein
MRTLSTLLIFLLALAVANSPASALQKGKVEVIEVKNIGISAADRSKSIIEVKWVAELQTGASIKSFDATIEVAYADGATERGKRTVSGSDRSTRFEVPTLHFSAARPGAELKNFKVSITATLTETASKQGSF